MSAALLLRDAVHTYCIQHVATSMAALVATGVLLP